jgi:hypothetical protein
MGASGQVSAAACIQTLTRAAMRRWRARELAEPSGADVPRGWKARSTRCGWACNAASGQVEARVRERDCLACWWRRCPLRSCGRIGQDLVYPGWGGGPVAAADHGRVGACECWHVQAVIGGNGAHRFAVFSGSTRCCPRGIGARDP